MYRPELQLFTDNWEIIRDEMQTIKNIYPNVRRPKADYDDLDPSVYNSVIQCEGWSVIEDTEDKWWNFPLFTYGKPTEPALKLAPKTVEVLKSIGGVNFSGFSVLLPFGMITPHYDEPATTSDPHGFITYHLGLDCPEHCYLIQEDKAILEENGKLINFICNKTHSAVNLSNKTRVILYTTFTR
jgi:hypothetical protein